jgi:hypothetical protein
MTVKELCDKLNSGAKLLDLSKIHNHTDFHTYIQEFCKNIIPEGSGLDFYFWKITYQKYSDDNVIEYDREFVQYKNCRHLSKGNFISVTFKVVDKELENLELKALGRYFKEKATVAKIKAYTEQIEKLEKELVEAKGRLKILQTHS